MFFFYDILFISQVKRKTSMIPEMLTDNILINLPAQSSCLFISQNNFFPFLCLVKIYFYCINDSVMYFLENQKHPV